MVRGQLSTINRTVLMHFLFHERVAGFSGNCLASTAINHV